MTLNELIPAIRSLSPAEKFQLVQIVLQQLAIEDGVTILPPKTLSMPLSPIHKKSLRGCLKSYAKPGLFTQEQDAWQTVASEKHESR